MRRAPEHARVFPVSLQRNAFGPRLTARAGDVWRALQDVVVDQSSDAGWTPERYVAADRMFIVRTMTVTHRRELRVDETLRGQTWVARARRDMLFTREVRLFSLPNGVAPQGASLFSLPTGVAPQGALLSSLPNGVAPQGALLSSLPTGVAPQGALLSSLPNGVAPQGALLGDDEPLAAATQEWALLTRALEPTRATRELYDAFTITEGFPSAALPAFTPQPGAWRSTHTFTTWHLWMDPHGHVNHPAYVDYCDESLARAVAKAGLDAQRLAPVAETVHFKAAIGAEATVVVETAFAGLAGDAGVFTHRVTADGKLAATATTVRRLDGEPGWVARVVG